MKEEDVDKDDDGSTILTSVECLGTYLTSRVGCVTQEIKRTGFGWILQSTCPEWIYAWRVFL